MEKVTAQAILENVEKCIAELQSMKTEYTYPKHHERISYGGYGYRENRKYYFKMDAVCDELSIFDWWNDNLSLNKLKDMQKFLKEAIKLGYTGYVCFKVGASGCANGMWAYKALSETGYSPNGEALYKSFTPDYNYWQICDENENWLPAKDEFDKLKTIKMLESYIAEMG